MWRKYGNIGFWANIQILRKSVDTVIALNPTCHTLIRAFHAHVQVAGWTIPESYTKRSLHAMGWQGLIYKCSRKYLEKIAEQ